MGWGSDPVCRLRAIPRLDAWGPSRQGEGMAPFTSDIRYSWEKGYLGPSFLCKGLGEHSCRVSSLSAPCPQCVSLSPLPAGSRLSASTLSLYLANAFLSLCHPPQRPPSPLSSWAPVLCVWHLVPRHAASTLRLTTYGFSLAEAGLSAAKGQGSASTSMLKCFCELHTSPSIALGHTRSSTATLNGWGCPRVNAPDVRLASQAPLADLEWAPCPTKPRPVTCSHSSQLRTLCSLQRPCAPHSPQMGP